MPDTLCTVAIKLNGGCHTARELIAMWGLAYHADKLWVVSVVTHGSTQVVGEHFAVDIDPRAPGIIISPLLQRPCTPSAHGAPLSRAHAWDRQTDWGRDASWLFWLIRRWLGVVHFFFKCSFSAFRTTADIFF